jgi:purine catabolism regulator
VVGHEARREAATGGGRRRGDGPGPGVDGEAEGDGTFGDAVGPVTGRGGELVDTLAVWLETRNMAEAARRMHVHYNTLKNRLERIEGIVGPVVADSARALECEIAIYITRHYEV